MSYWNILFLSRLPSLGDWSWDNIYLSIVCGIINRIVFCANTSLILKKNKRHLPNVIESYIEKPSNYI